MTTMRIQAWLKYQKHQDLENNCWTLGYIENWSSCKFKQCKRLTQIDSLTCQGNIKLVKFNHKLSKWITPKYLTNRIISLGKNLPRRTCDTQNHPLSLWKVREKATNWCGTYLKQCFTTTILTKNWGQLHIGSRDL